jgi:hypothetical protein
MKKIVLFITLFLSISIFAQKKETILKSITFSQKLVKKKGMQLLLRKVINDSRCPEGVNCIWAGECEIQVAIYKNQKLVSEENVLLSPKLYQENISWFSKYYPKLKITEIGVLPYPKSDVVTNPKDYFVRVYFE